MSQTVPAPPEPSPLHETGHSALTLGPPLRLHPGRLVVSDLLCASVHVALVKHLDESAELQAHRQSPKLGGLAALDVQEPLGNPSQSARTVVPISADDQNMGVGLEELPTTYYLLLAAYCYSNCGPTLRKVKAIPRAADDDLVSVRLRVGVRVGVRVRVRLGLGLA